jgi:predicted nucleic acid-binding Zn ribbon protein
MRRRPETPEPIRIGGLVDAVLEQLGLRDRVEEYRVVEAWEEIVGEALAKRVQALRIERGRLVLGVQSSPWLMEMRMREHEIMERIAERVGEGIVKEIRFERI